MRAQVLKEFGGPDNFWLETVPNPVVTQGHVLIRVAATSVNTVDTKIRAGLPIGPALPAILGADVAGVIVAKGEGVEGFEVGDAVYGCAGGVKGQGGALAELMLADAQLIAKKPVSLSMREAAALPLVAITAWDALERSRVSEGQTVLVHGGLGGVGHVAIQLAKARGAKVATTCSGEGSDALARSLGADAVIDYKAESVEGYVQRLTQGSGFDVVFDTIGGANLPTSFAAVAIDGNIATTNARTTQDLSQLHARALSLHVVFMLLPMLTGKHRARHGRILAELAAWVDTSKVKPLIDPHRFTLATAPDAHRLLESGDAVGKIVIDIDESIAA